jgi:hypothetical protein
MKRKTMRRLLGPILIGLGVFLVAAAGLIRFYAYPTLAVAPIDQNSVTELSAQDATIFDSNPKVLKDITTDLSIRSRTVGDVEGSNKAPDGVLCWVNTTVVTSSDGIQRSASVERMGHDEVTGEARDGCGSFTESEEGVREPVKPEGLIYKFPFNTKKKAYDFWDGDLGKAVPAEYDGEDTVDGMSVYRFVQTIPDTTIGTLEVPGSLLGSDDASVEADQHYQNTRTFYVEPATGAVVNRIDDQLSQLSYEGQTLTLNDSTVHYTDAQVSDLVDEIKLKAFLLKEARVVFPLLALGLGLLAIVGGLLLVRRGRPRKVVVEEKPRETTPLAGSAPA